MSVNLMHGDCLDRMQEISDDSIDLVLADPPYGTTACKWDSVIDLDRVWPQLDRICKINAAVVLTASQPFTTTLISSNMKAFKYCWVWEKSTATGHLNAKKMPMRAHEDIVVFYRKPPTYNPQKTTDHKRKISNVLDKSTLASDVYGTQKGGLKYDSTERYPRSVIATSTDKQKSKLHPTQKPVALMEYLMRTYSNLGDLVLDFTMGSGTTGVAACNLNRDFIGIEQDATYFALAENRIMEFEL